MTMYACLCFSDWLPEVKIRFNISYGLIGGLIASMVVILGGIVVQTFFNIKKTVRMRIAIHKLKIQRKKTRI